MNQNLSDFFYSSLLNQTSSSRRPTIFASPHPTLHQRPFAWTEAWVASNTKAVAGGGSGNANTGAGSSGSSATGSGSGGETAAETHRRQRRVSARKPIILRWIGGSARFTGVPRCGAGRTSGGVPYLVAGAVRQGGDRGSSLAAILPRSISGAVLVLLSIRHALLLQFKLSSTSGSGSRAQAEAETRRRIAHGLCLKRSCRCSAA